MSGISLSRATGGFGRPSQTESRRNERVFRFVRQSEKRDPSTEDHRKGAPVGRGLKSLYAIPVLADEVDLPEDRSTMG